MIRLTLCFALMCSLSCAHDIEPTEVVLVVNSDLMAPLEIDSLDVVVTSAGGEEMTSFARLNNGDPRLPRTLGIYNVDSRLGPYYVTARARLGGAIVVERSASFDFVRDRTMRLTLFLPSACQDVRCDTPLTCVEGGVCGSSDLDLVPWTGSVTGSRLSPDAGMDAMMP